jgi:hypothetical protein
MCSLWLDRAIKYMTARYSQASTIIPEPQIKHLFLQRRISVQKTVQYVSVIPKFILNALSESLTRRSFKKIILYSVHCIVPAIKE